MFKTLAVAAVVATAATTTSVSAYAVYPQLCSTLELAKLATILGTNLADFTECSKNAGGWTFIPPTRAPTAEEETLMCGNEGCKKLLAGIQKLKPADCWLSTNNSAVGINAKQLVDEFEPFCELVSL